MIVITDVCREKDGMEIREKTVAVFGTVIYRRSECYPVEKDRPVGFNSCGTNLTYIEDE